MQAVLKKFEELGYEINCNINNFIRLKSKESFKTITIYLDKKQFICHHFEEMIPLLIDFQEIQLINELFKKEAQNESIQIRGK